MTPIDAQPSYVRPGFASLPDLAARRFGGGVIAANDELFADRENLVVDNAPRFALGVFGPKGQVMDGWESRRRREPGHDWAIVRLGMPGVVRGVVLDTSFFTGNYPPEVSIEGIAVEGYPSPAELEAADWTPLVPRSTASGDTQNTYPVDCEQWVTHVRLCQYPDGGVARLRVHGEPVPDPRLVLTGAIDLAALANGATVTGCSDMFYSPPINLVSPGEARTMGEGWETARRRDDGNDWVELRLVSPGVIRLAELDTRHFVGNAPGWASLRGYDDRVNEHPASPEDWVELLPRTRLQADTPHRFRLAPRPEVSHVRLDIYPDGGMARLRLHGELTRAGRERLALRWLNLLGDDHARQVLEASAAADSSGLPVDATDALLAGRPLVTAAALPPGLRRAFGV